MEHKQAAKLIIENIQLLEKANNLINEVLSEELSNEIDQIIQNEVENFETEIIGIYDFTDSDTWFLSTQWKIEPFELENSKTHNNLYAFYQFTNEERNKHTNNWWMSNLFENETDQMVLCFSFWKNGFNKASGNDWKRFALEMNQNYPILEQLGFKFNVNNQTWYMPINYLDQKLVVENYMNETLEDALTPIKEALEKLKLAHPTFNQIVQNTINKFNIPDTQ
ncbi:hypothetical protein [Acinetobacter terrae]|jgi:hypothetical protein|uniref:hypothetical protein n=1 Tax=Acinetobacter terrae TaxID=2731247 RepID=UPI0007D78648|nr:hypothetical protein [Acinetobacter terrae]OAL88383.1 hypothetical protein AY608_00910 [Acinetobacter terrae]